MLIFILQATYVGKRGGRKESTDWTEELGPESSGEYVCSSTVNFLVTLNAHPALQAYL